MNYWISIKFGTIFRLLTSSYLLLSTFQLFDIHIFLNKEDIIVKILRGQLTKRGDHQINVDVSVPLLTAEMWSKIIVTEFCSQSHSKVTSGMHISKVISSLVQVPDVKLGNHRGILHPILHLDHRKLHLHPILQTI